MLGELNKMFVRSGMIADSDDGGSISVRSKNLMSSGIAIEARYVDNVKASRNGKWHNLGSQAIAISITVNGVTSDVDYASVDGTPKQVARCVLEIIAKKMEAAGYRGKEVSSVLELSGTSRPRVVVCAAIRHRELGIVVCGPRHGHCFQLAQRLNLESNWEQGFVDQFNEFMNRETAWKVADRMLQLRCPTGHEPDFSQRRTEFVGDDGMLFSENLY